ncbi:hypothetical protein L6R52_29995 [Myxococcota bacterium]|nr:hypothetical protein [Myxococcota bacterium]
MRPWTRRVLLSLTLAALAGGCSFVLDFDDVTGLPCPCDSNHVCLIPSDTCFPRNSVEIGKSCDLGAETPDDLCPEGSICEAINGEGKRCLLTCTPSNYATPESQTRLAAQCPLGTTCWATPRGVGVCSEGVCNDLPNNCPPPQQCVRFNGAGVCFTPCNIFETNPLPCAGSQMCHPIGDSSVAACVDSGTVQRSEICSDVDMCSQLDEFGRPLVCDRPIGASTIDQRRCRAICVCPAGALCDNASCNTGAACGLSRPAIEPATQAGLGLCLE